MNLPLEITESFYDLLEDLAIKYGCSSVNDLLLNLISSSLTAELLKIKSKKSSGISEGSEEEEGAN